MAALDFPASPTLNQTYTANGNTWKWNGTSWVTANVVSGGQFYGTATPKAIAYNANSISENITITVGTNAISASPISIASGNTVTVESGANWVIV